jgi:hypothetical protein
MAIDQDKWVLVESEPLAGLEATTTFHDTFNDAKIYVQPRKDLFGRFDLGQVRYRRLVRKVIESEEFED